MEKSISTVRKNKGLSQTELAEKVGCTQTNISHIELGKQIPSLGLAKKIAEILEMDVMDILYPSEHHE